MNYGKLIISAAVLLAVCELGPLVLGQPAAQQTPTPVVISPEVAADRQITFRLLAPQAESVGLTGSDIPGMGQRNPGAAQGPGMPQAKRMTKGDKGIWEITIGPIPSGSYRYNFNVNGVAGIGPRHPR